MAFSIGESVEICCSQEDGSVGPYYGGRVLGRFGNNLYKVQHNNMLNDDKSGPLVEIVTAEELRPEPRRRMPTDFSLLEEVDAFANDGWRVGKVTDKLIGWKYRVYFENSREEIVYPLYRLRIHEDWINGQWVSSKNRTLCFFLNHRTLC